MPSWLAFFAPIALFLPSADAPDTANERAFSGEEKAQSPVAATQRWDILSPLELEQPRMQVRIQQRVVIRISPARTQRNLVADLPQSFPTRFAERKMGECLPVRDVLGVQTGGPSKLILFMRDRKMISAQLEKACRARDFYSGFYVEPSKDGRLCIQRDKLQSRNGAKCELSELKRLELVRN